MRNLLRSPDVAPEHSPDPQRSRRGLDELMTGAVRNPLAALRAALEAVASGNGSGATPEALIKRALETLSVVSKGTELLYDYAAPRPERPLPCTLGEVARSALAGLSSDLRERVILATEDPQQSFETDGPLLAAALQRTLEDILGHSSGDILFHAAHDTEEVWFAVLANPQQGVPPDWRNETQSDPQESVERMIARRDVDRMQGRVARSWSRSAPEAVLVCVPLAPASSLRSGSDERGVA